MGKLSNVSLTDFRRFLKSQGLEFITIKGGHEKWSKKGLLRPIVFQTHIDPMPEMILRSNLRTLRVTTDSFIAFFNKKSL